MSKKCPECGSPNIQTERRPDGFHHCIDCRHTWKIENKTCGECRFYHPIFKHEGVCICTSELRKTCDFTTGCAIGGVYPKPQITLFDRITASTEVLAEKLVYCVKFATVGGNGFDRWYSTLEPFDEDVYYYTKEQAIAATVARLKEVYNETTSD